MSELTLTVRKTIPAPQEKVFEAWLDARMLAKFMRPGTDVSVPKAETDAREGGRFSILMLAGDKEIPHAGTYLEVTPHSRIVFTWESPYSTDDSTVTLDFTAAGDDATDVALTHVKFPSEESRDNHKGGWTAILDTLATAFG